MAGELAINQSAPNFTLPASGEGVISLNDFKGKFVILFFCNQGEAANNLKTILVFNDKYWDFVRYDAVVLGISLDDLAHLRKIVEKYNLPYPLLSDVGHMVAELYGVWGKQEAIGQQHWGVRQSVFVIDQKGKIKKILQQSKPEEFVDAAWQAIKDNSN